MLPLDKILFLLPMQCHPIHITIAISASKWRFSDFFLSLDVLRKVINFFRWSLNFAQVVVVVKFQWISAYRTVSSELSFIHHISIIWEYIYFILLNILNKVQKLLNFSGPVNRTIKLTRMWKMLYSRFAFNLSYFMLASLTKFDSTAQPIHKFRGNLELQKSYDLQYSDMSLCLEPQPKIYPDILIFHCHWCGIHLKIEGVSMNAMSMIR